MILDVMMLNFKEYLRKVSYAKKHLMMYPLLNLKL